MLLATRLLGARNGMAAQTAQCAKHRLQREHAVFQWHAHPLRCSFGCVGIDIVEHRIVCFLQQQHKRGQRQRAAATPVQSMQAQDVCCVLCLSLYVYSTAAAPPPQVMLQHHLGCTHAHTTDLGSLSPFAESHHPRVAASLVHTLLLLGVSLAPFQQPAGTSAAATTESAAATSQGHGAVAYGTSRRVALLRRRVAACDDVVSAKSSQCARQSQQDP